MEFLASYILSIVGIILVGIVVDLMLVDGQVKKYVQSIYVLFVVFTIVAPLPTFITNIKRGDFSFDTATVEIDKNYLNVIKSQKDSAFSTAIERAFSEEGYNQIKVTIVSNMDNNEYTIDKICVDISNCSQYISRSVAIKYVLKVVEIEEEDIEIYE